MCPGIYENTNETTIIVYVINVYETSVPLGEDFEQLKNVQKEVVKHIDIGNCRWQNIIIIM